MSTYDERTKRYDEDPVFRSLANIITDVDPWAQRQLQAADAILAAGWRPPARQVATVEELEALAEESVVIDGGGDAWQKLTSAGDNRVWHEATGGQYGITNEALADGFYEPLTVIHEGGA